MELSKTRKRTNTFRVGMTQYGFPSTLNQGKRVPIVGDHDPQIENVDMVTKAAPVQSSIQALRKETREQGSSGGGEGAASGSKEGSFGGIARVFDGIMHTESQYRRVPVEARVEAKRQKDKLW